MYAFAFAFLSSRDASGSLVGFSASSDDDEKQVCDSEIVPKASSERSRKTLK